MHPTQAALEGRFPTLAAGRAARLAPVTLVLVLVLTMFGTDAARADTLVAPQVSPGARATVALAVRVAGSADASATLRVFVQQQGGGCATDGTGEERAYTQSLRPGSTEVIAQQPAGPFSYDAVYTPPVAGLYWVCAYLFGSTSNAGTSQASTSFTVGAAPSPPPAGTTTSPLPATSLPPSIVTGTEPRPARCIVPTLKGRTYLGARTRIRRAGCSVGTVFRPDLRARRVARAQGKVLRVVSQSPKGRSIRRAGFRVMLRLQYVAPPRTSRKR